MKTLTTIFPILIAATALTISIWNFKINRPEEVLERQKHRQMRVIATETMLVFKQIVLFSNLKDSSILKNDYNLSYYKINIKRLEESLEEGIKLGLINELLGTDSTKTALEMHLAFRRNLAIIPEFDINEKSMNDWIPEHFTMGIIRLVDQCYRYDNDIFPSIFTDKELGKIQSLRHTAYTYLEK